MDSNLSEAILDELRETKCKEGVASAGADTKQEKQQSHNHDHRSSARTDDNGLILPKKLVNPCLESREVQDLNREIKWNSRL